MTGPAHGDAAAFSSAGLVALVIASLRREDPRLLPADLRDVDPMRGAMFDPSAKRAILDHAYRRGGAAPLLRVGRILPEVAHSPTIAVLAASRHPAVLAEKWMRFERYHHSDNRTAIAVEVDSYACTRASKTPGATPAPCENVLICGLLAGLVALAGGVDVGVEIGGRQAGADGDFEIAALDDAATGQFAIAWRDFAPRGPEPREGSHEPRGGASATGRLAALLKADPGRNWRLDEASGALGLSTRTLQRALTDEGRSFSTVMRGARFDEAGRMLIETDSPLAEIGYCCGYADQAHFQRDFQRAANMTPARFRQTARL